MKNLILTFTLCLIGYNICFASSCGKNELTYTEENQQYNTQQQTIYYTYGVHKIDKEHYIFNLRSNISSYLEYKLAHGWNYYYVEEFQHAYAKFLNALSDPRDPYRLHTDDFGTIIDNRGILNDIDSDDYWYDNSGNRISGFDYRYLSDKKKKKYKTFHANGEVVYFFNEVAKTLVENQYRREH